MRKTLKVTYLLSALLLFVMFVSLFIMYKLNTVLPWKIYPGSSNFIESKSNAESLIKEQRLKPITLIFHSDLCELDVTQFLDVSVTVKPTSFINWLFDDDLQYMCDYNYNSSKLNEALEKVKMKSEDAKIVLNSDGTFTLIGEQINRDFDIEDAKELVYSAVRNEEFSVDMSSICNKPLVTSDSLQEEFSKVSWVNDFEIVYTCGSRITSKDLYNCWEPDLTFNIEKLNLDHIFDSLISNYDTTNNSLNFRTSSGKDVTVPYKTYGVCVDIDKELEYIKSLIGTHTSICDRIPNVKGYDDFSNTYIEVSIADQHLWHYVNGILCCETDVVTGTKGVHDTPIGVFYVSEMIPGKNLRGTNYVTWVNRWMRLTNSGIGLHDAYWRSSFGKNIYTYGGSHGCVNLPKNYAYKLYGEITRGTTVVIYDEGS